MCEEKSESEMNLNVISPCAPSELLGVVFLNEKTRILFRYNLYHSRTKRSHL